MVLALVEGVMVDNANATLALARLALIVILASLTLLVLAVLDIVLLGAIVIRALSDVALRVILAGSTVRQFRAGARGRAGRWARALGWFRLSVGEALLEVRAKFRHTLVMVAQSTNALSVEIAVSALTNKALGERCKITPETLVIVTVTGFAFIVVLTIFAFLGQRVRLVGAGNNDDNGQGQENQIGESRHCVFCFC